jgi:hypothetical protein
MQTKRPVRVIKQNDPLNDGGQDYVRRHEQSLIALLVPRHIEYTRRELEKAARRDSSPGMTQEVAQRVDF